MAADADVEIEATLARLATLAGGRVFETAAPDETSVTLNGKVFPHIVVDFGDTVRTRRDRILSTGEVNQPHILPVNVACIAGTASAARKLAKAVITLLLDWAPSNSSTGFAKEGGYSGGRSATANTPSRFVRGVFLEATVNNNYPSA